MRPSGVPTLPEDGARLNVWRRALHENERAIVDGLASVREGLAREGLILLEGAGVPLRPLFLDRRRLDVICQSLHRQHLALGERLLDAVREEREALREELPLPAAFFDHVDVAGALSHPDFGLVLRPDGFLYDDRFVLTEPNFGNGYLISGAYPELVYRVFEHVVGAAPELAQGPTGDLEARVLRPLVGILDLIEKKARAGAPSGERPLVALLTHREEDAIIRSWEERVILLVDHFEARVRARGLTAVRVHEDGLHVDDDGVARLPDGRRVDLVFQIPIGTFFLFEAERLGGDLAHLAGPRVGQAPFLQPLAHLLIDKGTLPLLSRLEGWPVVDQDGFEVQCAATAWPHPDEAAALRTEKDHLVLKRSFTGKDTWIGPVTPGRQWNKIVDEACRTADYIVQEALPLARCSMPVVIDDRIEWIDVRCELSLFILEGRYAGGFARYAPDAEGLVLSPPPPGMGFTLLWA